MNVEPYYTEKYEMYYDFHRRILRYTDYYCVHQKWFQERFEGVLDPNHEEKLYCELVEVKTIVNF